MKVAPVPGTQRAASWSWRLLVSAGALVTVLALLWNVRVIVVPAMVALTIAPALAPVAGRLRGSSGRRLRSRSRRGSRWLPG